MPDIFDLKLDGCTPEPLMNYLKALGVLRLVAEQKDPNARGAWINDVFVLRSSLDRERLLNFFMEEYEPTPIVVPWSGGDFFGVDRAGNIGPYKKTPTSTKVIEAFIACASDRLSSYRRTILTALDTLEACSIDSKKAIEGNSTKNRALKAKYVACLRDTVDDSVVDWIDAAAILTTEKALFSAILGSGGGSDGNTHFSDNFMQNLWDVLPDFEAQRGHTKVPWRHISQAQLAQAVFRTASASLVNKRTSSLYDSGAVGGPNATQGIERDSLGNPWAFILCLEGAISLAGAITRRNQTASASFPFQVRLTTAGSESLASNETAGFETWLPLYSSWVSFPELRALLAEGRASLAAKSLRSGVDVAKAAAGLAVDRGIGTLQRFGIVKGRLGDTNTAAFLGQLKVRFQRNVDLLADVDQWLDGFRHAATKEKAPARFSKVIRDIDQSIFQFCQFGGTARFQEILRALGRAERELANGPRFREKNYLQPIGNLSTQWIAAADDGSVEFELALSLASIFDTEGKVGDLRINLEPVAWQKFRWRWADNGGSVVWNRAELSANLASVLGRRFMDARRQGCTHLPLMSRRRASIESISAFIHGHVDDGRLEELLWGLMLVEHTQKDYPQIAHSVPRTTPLPRAYALLKLLFLPGALAVDSKGNGRQKIRLARATEGAIQIKPEARVLSLLRSGRLDESTNLAVRRLHASGLRPMIGSDRRSRRIEAGLIDPFGISTQRLAAALLFPVSSSSIERLFNLVISPDRGSALEKGGTQ